MERLVILQKLIEATGCKIRLKPYNYGMTEWRSHFGIPVQGYIEVTGPERVVDVDWVELDPIVVTHIGRLVPPRVTVVIDTLLQALDEAGIQCKTVKGMIRIAGIELW